jgi:hypothetical protein
VLDDAGVKGVRFCGGHGLWTCRWSALGWSRCAEGRVHASCGIVEAFHEGVVSACVHNWQIALVIFKKFLSDGRFSSSRFS